VFSASDLRDTLLLLVPGFLALKIFAWRGFQARRTDLEWTLWSLLVAGLINGALTLAQLPAQAIFATSVVVAVALGFALGAIWQLWAKRRPHALAPVVTRAWDVVLLERPRWVQVRLKDGARIFGKTRTVAESASTDDLDLYLTDCEWLLKDGTRWPMAGVEGVLVARSEISRLQILKGKPKAPPKANPGR
jgi:Family of unknown function (DUF6338)